MLKYILKRVLFFIPTLLIVSLLTFTLGVNSPGDPVDVLMDNSENAKFSNYAAKEVEYLRVRKQLHLDLPVFYFSISSFAETDTMYRIPQKLHRENLERLVDMYGNWPQVQQYYVELRKFDRYLKTVPVADSLKDSLILLSQTVYDLYNAHEEDVISYSLSSIGSTSSFLFPNQSRHKALSAAYFEMKNSTSTWKNYIPSFQWYGFQNQYHVWVSNMFVGDFGVSYFKRQPVVDMISDRIFPTLLFSVLSVLISFLVSIPVGVYSAINKGTGKDKLYTISLFILYSLPSFWLATLLINYLCNPEFLDIFPVKGLNSGEENLSVWDSFTDHLSHMILPLFCYTYSSFAFISRQMRGSMLDTLSQDYIRTAWAKGLAPKTVYWKHAVRNSLLPIITLVASILPSLIAGSVVIELLFTLPGMGKLVYEAEVSKDFPVIYIVMLFSAVLTLLGYLVADILYAIVDPRISYSKK
jgi:peptide/nickel transport system permease protein